MWQFFHPSSFHIIQPLLESVHYDFVNSLDLSISLGIRWGRISIHNSQITAVSSKRFTIKLKTIVQDKGTRDLKLSDNVFPNKLLGVHIFDIRQGLSFNPLGKIARADQQISLVPYCFGERANNIQAPLSKWLGDWGLLLVGVCLEWIFSNDHISLHIPVLPFAYLAINNLEWWLYKTNIFLLYGFHKSLHVTPQGVVLTP